MNLIVVFILLTLLQFLSGFGLLCWLRLWLKPGLFIPLAVLSGVAIFSVVPILLQFFFIPLTSANIFISLVAVCILLNINSIAGLKHLHRCFRNNTIRIALYEIPFLLVVSLLILVSAWRCFYYPPTPRDLNSGPEVVAEYTIREKTMINSVYEVDLSTTNNPFKSTFVTSLQVIYKYAGFPFGQVWLVVIFASFTIFLYHVLNLTLHRFLSGLLLLCFIAIPEMYAYTFMALYDYSNAIFFFLSAWLFFEYLKNGKFKFLVAAGIAMGISVYIRSETLLLAALMLGIIFWNHARKRLHLKKYASSVFVFIIPSMLIYLLFVNFYINYYLPVEYNIGSQVNKKLMDLAPFFERFGEMNGELIYSRNGVNYYGYFIFLFLLIMVMDMIWTEELNYDTRNWLYAVAVIYFGLPFLGYLLPLMDLHSSTKRGLMKIFPLMLLCMAHSGFLKKCSEKIKNWELK